MNTYFKKLLEQQSKQKLGRRNQDKKIELNEIRIDIVEIINQPKS